MPNPGRWAQKVWPKKKYAAAESYFGRWIFGYHMDLMVWQRLVPGNARKSGAKSKGWFSVSPLVIR